VFTQEIKGMIIFIGSDHGFVGKEKHFGQYFSFGRKSFFENKKMLYERKICQK
jgi:hypothetical protein